MNNILIFCQQSNDAIMDVSLELLTKGRELATKSNVSLDAVIIGKDVKRYSNIIFKYGVETLYVAEDDRLEKYITQPYSKILTNVARISEPSVVLIGATKLGRDLAPRVAAELKTGITADCTRLEMADYTDPDGRVIKNVLQEIRPSFIGNQLTTIIEPYARPQMATVREGVMNNEPLNNYTKGKIVDIDTKILLSDETDFLVNVIDETKNDRANNLKKANIVIAGGYGVGSQETFDKLWELADLIGAEVGATRAAVDAGYVSHDRMIGQTGLTVNPKLYIAFGISGQVQHTVGMDKSSVIVAVNTDPNAPIHKIADYSIVGDTKDVVLKMINSLMNERR